MADSPTITDSYVRSLYKEFRWKSSYTDVGSQQFVETVIHNNTDHILTSHGLLETCDITYMQHAEKLHHCNVEGVLGSQKSVLFSVSAFLWGGCSCDCVSCSLFG